MLHHPAQTGLRIASTKAVQDFGYKTTSPSLRTIVNQTLINSEKFKRIERAYYTAK